MKKSLLTALAMGVMTLCSQVAMAQPTTSAPTPTTYGAGKCITIFSDANTQAQVGNLNVNPNWGQTTLYQEFTVGTDKMLQYSNLNYQGIEFADQNCLAMEYIHVDIYTTTAQTLQIFPINHAPQQEQPYNLALEADKWNSFDIPVTAFTIGFNAIYQFKFEGTGTIWVDNLYLYTTDTTVDEDAPTDVTATVGTITGTSVELKLTAQDASDLSYIVTYGSASKTFSASAGVETSCVIDGLTPLTAYTFSIVAKDLYNNEAAAITATATTIAHHLSSNPAPTPTAKADSVKSIFSDAYTTDKWFIFGAWGQSTVASRVSITESDEVIELTNFNYLGLEINGNAPGQDYSAYTHLHIDIYSVDASSIMMEPISGGGETFVTKQLTTGAWNSFDIALTDFTCNKANIFQLKFDGGQGTHLYLDNIYFVDKGGSSTDPEDPDPTTPKDACSADYGHFATPTAVKMHAEISYQSNGDILFTVNGLNNRPIDFAEVQITNVGNYSMTITDGVATYTLSGRAKGEELLIRYLYSTDELPGNEMTAETQVATDANIIKYTVGECDSSSTTDVDNTRSALAIYPMPATDVINIAADKTVASIDIFNLIGQRVASHTATNQISVANLTTGQYIVRILFTDSTVATKKITKL